MQVDNFLGFKYLTRLGWRVEVIEGSVSILPPQSFNAGPMYYVTGGDRDLFAGVNAYTWSGGTRSLLLPGGAKVTMHAPNGALTSVSLYDTDQSHQVLLDRPTDTHTLVHSKVDAATSAAREDAEHDGTAGHLEWVGGLYLANIYTQNAGVDGVPGPKLTDIHALGQSVGNRAYVYPVVMPNPAPVVTTACESTAVPRGSLTQAGGVAAPLTYTTRSGEWVVKIDRHTITVTGFGKFTWEVWGDGKPHENLNGKHIKDWLTLHRSLLLPDGTKITMHANGSMSNDVLHTTSIYDGAQSHEIGNANNLVRHSCSNTEVARQRDAAEVDGETAYFVKLATRPSTLGALFTFNLYDRALPESDPTSIPLFAPLPLGTTGDVDINPNQVNDLFDDPRLAHT